MTDFPLLLESIRDLEDEHIKKIFELAKCFKEGSKSTPSSFFSPLSPPLIATNFFENSTRTKLSFTVAIKKIGAIPMDLGEAGSSLAKGESLRDTFLTQKAIGIKLGIVRSANSGELNRFKQSLPYPMINAGDGMHQHPTQALIDLFTMLELGLEVQNATMVIIGDSLHSRVSHSLIDLFPRLGGKLILCGPHGCLPEFIDSENIKIEHCLETALRSADWVYQLRVQKERHKVFSNKGFFNEYFTNYGLSTEKLDKLNIKPLIFNPGPAAIGTEISEKLIRSDLYMGNKQVENSVPIRMALLWLMLEQLHKEGRL